MMLPFVPGLHPLLVDLVYLVTPQHLGHPERGKQHARAPVWFKLMENKPVNEKCPQSLTVVCSYSQLLVMSVI